MSRFSRTALLASAVLGCTLVASRAHAYDPYDPYYYDTPRLRFGLSGIGGGFGGHIDGGFGGIEPRIGVQFNNYIAVYYQGQWLMGDIFSSGSSGSLGGFSFNSVMFDLTLAHFFQIGVGPSMDYIWGCQSSAGQTACSDAGPYFGVNGRIAFVVGGWGYRHRHGLTFSAEVHPTVLRGDAVTAFLFGIGGELF